MDVTDHFVIPRWTKVTLWIVGSVVAAAIAFAVVKPIKVVPRIGLAPGYSMVDQAGSGFNSEMARASVTLYSFAPLDCGNRCGPMFSTVADVRRRAAEVDLGGADLRFVTVVLADAPDVAAVREAATAAGADGEVWRWVAGERDEIRTVVGSGFGQYFELAPDGDVRFDPGFVLVDAEGIIRAEYQYRALASDSDRIVRQLGLLGDEIRNSHGAASAAYEAAHLFLCYG